MAAVLLLSLASGCATNQSTPRSPYRWGIYEDLIYDEWTRPGAVGPAEASLRLGTDISTTDASGSVVPPGVHAHLGYLYYAQGNPAAAQVEFELERSLYPESTVFIDGLLARMRKAGELPEPHDQEASAAETGSAAADGAAAAAPSGTPGAVQP